jgi:hypothetical protein
VGKSKKLKAIQPVQYKSLKKGSVYLFESYVQDGKKIKPRVREGRLISVVTKLRDNKNEKGKIISTELVGDKLAFEPVDEEDQWTVWEPTGEKLRVSEIHVHCGMFRVLSR